MTSTNSEQQNYHQTVKSGKCAFNNSCPMCTHVLGQQMLPVAVIIGALAGACARLPAEVVSGS